MLRISAGRRMCFAGFVIVACGALAAPKAGADKPDDAPPEGLLLKDSFEEGDEAPTGWEPQNAAKIRLNWDRETASNGKRSLCLDKAESRFFPISGWKRTLAHQGRQKSLEVQVQVKAQDAQKAVVDVLFLDEQGQWIKHEWAAYIGAKKANDPPANHDWKKYRGVVAIPPKTKSIVLELQMYGPGKVWFDELEAKYAAPGKAAAGKKADQPADEPPADKTIPKEALAVPVQDGAIGNYLLVVPDAQKGAPQAGISLLVVLPGGDGSADFHPFVGNIGKEALGDEWLIAQPLAVRWTPGQQIVWPTAKNKVPGMKFSTEELIGKVIDDVAAKHKVRRDRVVLLGWSSGGPAVYATMLQKKSPATSAFVAMSVFKPDALPALANGKGRSFYLLHSPEDRVCPYRMARAAKESLEKTGAHVTLADYDGGHGWQGDVYGNIRQGIDWLLDQPAVEARGSGD